MTIVLLLAFGQCHPSLVQSYAEAQAAAAAAVYAPVYAVWRVGEDEYQTQMIERLTAIAEQNQQILQAIRSSGAAAPVGPAESAVTTAAKEVMKASCVKCHNATNKKGEIDLTGPLDAQTKLLVEEVSRSGAMPPKSEGKELSDEDFAKISAWAHEDKDAVRAALRAKREPKK